MKFGAFDRLPHSYRICSLAMAVGLALSGGFAYAAIPEPSAVLWGELENPSGFPIPQGEVVEVVHGVSGVLLGSYVIDFSSPAGFGAVLKIPLADLSDGSALPPGTLQVGDPVDLRLASDPGQILYSTVVTERGQIDHFSVQSIALPDSDGDGIPDFYETNNGLFVSRVDTGSDPNNPDSDGDGVNDGDEVNAGTDPNVIRGDINDDGTIDLADVLLLQRVLNGETPVVPVFPGEGDVAPFGAPDQQLTAADLVVLMRVVSGEISLP